MVKTLGQVAEYWLSDPQRALEVQTQPRPRLLDLWADAVKRMAGEPTAAGRRARSARQALRRSGMVANQFFDFLKQAYLLTARWADQLVKDAEGSTSTPRHKAEFYVQADRRTRSRRRTSC